MTDLPDGWARAGYDSPACERFTQDADPEPTDHDAQGRPVVVDCGDCGQPTDVVAGSLVPHAAVDDASQCAGSGLAVELEERAPDHCTIADPDNPSDRTVLRDRTAGSLGLCGGDEPDEAADELELDESGQLVDGSLQRLLVRHGVQLPATAMDALLDDVARLVSGSLVRLGLRLGFPPDPPTIREREELDALPVESVVRDGSADVCERAPVPSSGTETGWRKVGTAEPVVVQLPALVLWVGER